MSGLPEIKIGDTYFVFNENRRVYKKDKANRSFGAPIFKEHFELVEIKGKTSRSWLYGHWNKKVPKSAPWVVLHTPSMVDDKCWEHEHRHKIANLVGYRSTTVETLKKIAEMIGYIEEIP
jgi:hypothetical protein